MINISKKSNGRIIEKCLKFLSIHSVIRNRSLNFTPAFFRRFEDLVPMLLWMLFSSCMKSLLDFHLLPLPADELASKNVSSDIGTNNLK